MSFLNRAKEKKKPQGATPSGVDLRTFAGDYTASVAPLYLNEETYAIISPELVAKLEELAQESGHSKSELIQAGINLVELALKAKERGKKFGVVEEDVPLVTEVVGL